MRQDPLSITGTFWSHPAQIREFNCTLTCHYFWRTFVFYQRTLLHMAVEEGHKDTVIYLVDKGASIDTEDDDGVSLVAILLKAN